MKAALIAGVISGMAGLLVFLTIHHFWIKPIWFIAPIGLMIAGLGGLAVGRRARVFGKSAVHAIAAVMLGFA